MKSLPFLSVILTPRHPTEPLSYSQFILGAEDVEWTCPHCQQLNHPLRIDQCAKCGALRVSAEDDTDSDSDDDNKAQQPSNSRRPSAAAIAAKALRPSDVSPQQLDSHYDVNGDVYAVPVRSVRPSIISSVGGSDGAPPASPRLRPAHLTVPSVGEGGRAPSRTASSASSSAAGEAPTEPPALPPRRCSDQLPRLSQDLWAQVEVPPVASALPAVAAAQPAATPPAPASDAAASQSSSSVSARRRPGPYYVAARAATAASPATAAAGDDGSSYQRNTSVNVDDDNDEEAQEVEWEILSPAKPSLPQPPGIEQQQSRIVFHRSNPFAEESMV